tara:strand:- start:2473 stop:2625 length:153 start_codon:yes stop_codon:yes gene_type:complete
VCPASLEAGLLLRIEQCDRIAELAPTAKGQVVISVNDVPTMREVFQGLDL